jgi:hypothetical protein
LSGLFVFTAGFFQGCKQGGWHMTGVTTSNRKAAKAAPVFSLDSWAVILALALSGAIWIGWIKHIPW